MNEAIKLKIETRGGITVLLGSIHGYSLYREFSTYGGAIKELSRLIQLEEVKYGLGLSGYSFGKPDGDKL